MFYQMALLSDTIYEIKFHLASVEIRLDIDEQCFFNLAALGSFFLGILRQKIFYCLNRNGKKVKRKINQQREIKKNN